MPTTLKRLYRAFKQQNLPIFNVNTINANNKFLFEHLKLSPQVFCHLRPKLRGRIQHKNLLVTKRRLKKGNDGSIATGTPIENQEIRKQTVQAIVTEMSSHVKKMEEQLE
jgi:hypothetical protein